MIDGEAVVFIDDGRSDFHAPLTKRAERRPRWWLRPFASRRRRSSSASDRGTATHSNYRWTNGNRQILEFMDCRTLGFVQLTPS
jgi:hypothetical protein